ncbi:uncharacterized protein ACWYII_014506 [Salvelinus alpinus]
MCFFRYTPWTDCCVFLLVNVKDQTVSSCPGCRWARCCCEMLFVTQMPTTRSHMDCDRVEDGSVDRLGEENTFPARTRGRHATGPRDYDFEANDPDRWRHSGFKELYPEEFKRRETVVMIRMGIGESKSPDLKQPNQNI